MIVKRQPLPILGPSVIPTPKKGTYLILDKMDNWKVFGQIRALFPMSKKG